MLLLMIGLTVIAITQVNQINDTLRVLNEVNSVKQRYAINIRSSVHDRATSSRFAIMMMGLVLSCRQGIRALFGVDASINLDAKIKT